MRVHLLTPERFEELSQPPEGLPPQGFLWLACGRDAFEARLAEVQSLLRRWTGGELVDLHVSDLLNINLPSHYDDTSRYDLLVFRRLAAVRDPEAGAQESAGRPRIDTSAVGFVVFDRVLLTVHPDECTVREHFAQRLVHMSASGAGDLRSGRLPASPQDLMLRMVNHIVDSYLDLRRLLTRQFADLQRDLLATRRRSVNWPVLLEARNTLHLLEDICEDQHSAVQEWIDAFEELPPSAEARVLGERELLRVRSRDVLEHIERVLGHVRRLESSAEAAVQMHFSALSQRTNDVMRTLTALTAIFLPLNLITGIFGMNFDQLPLIHHETGAWIAFGIMGLVGLGFGAYFWRKRYLGTHDREH